MFLILLLCAGVEPNPGPQPWLNFATQNARSVVAKAAHIHSLLNDFHLDVLAITETWMQSDAPNAIHLDTAPSGYQVIHCPRGSSVDKSGGGIAIGHRDCIQVRDLDHGRCSEFESLVVKLTSLSKSIIIACVCRPPGVVSNAFCDSLANLVDQLQLAGTPFLVCGDLNCPGISGTTLDVKLIDILERHGLTQHVKTPTHDAGNLLDVIVTADDDSELVSHISVRPTCFSDHHTVACRLNVFNRQPTAVRCMYRNIRRINLAAFHDDIRKSALYNFSNYQSVDQYVELFQRETNRILDRHAPLRTRTRRVGRNDCRWLSAEARAAKQKCRRLERRYNRTKAPENKQAYNAARRTARDAISRSRSNYLKEQYSRVMGDGAATWRLTRAMLHRDNQPQYSDEECRLLTVGFGDFFREKLLQIQHSITSSLAQLPQRTYTFRKYDGPVLSDFASVTAEEVQKILMTSPPKPSPQDIFPTALLQSSAEVVAPILAHMANLSFTECRFPDAFKTAQVRPLIKKPGMDKAEFSSYRPISNLPVISKVLERLVLARLKPQLLRSSNFTRLQSAFRRGHSTETALLRVLNDVYASADVKGATVIVGLDISAAFDTICHSVLIDRLQEEYGLRGTVIMWLRSYLSDRRQFVKLGSQMSPVTACSAGVPQGSVLGPLLFAAYVSPVGDLIESFGISFHQFADDTQLYVGLNSGSAASSMKQLTACTAAVRHWFLLNGLKLNADKSEAMLLWHRASAQISWNCHSDSRCCRDSTATG
jgi:hypothetical protein